MSTHILDFEKLDHRCWNVSWFG